MDRQRCCSVRSLTARSVNQAINGVPGLIDKNGIVHMAKAQDPNLVNPWGVGESAASPFWVSDNGAGVSTLYNTPGQPQALVVSIPAPGEPLGNSGAPTGLVFNVALGQKAFEISGVDRMATRRRHRLFSCSPSRTGRSSGGILA